MDRFRIAFLDLLPALLPALLVALLLAGLGPRAGCAEENPGVVDFNRQIRPILSQNCFVCHGPDADQRQADLRLDTPQGAAAALQPGESEASELYLRITSDDPDLQMPPPDSKRTLTAAQMKLVKRWIDSGAQWGDHWSFTPLQRPPLPTAVASSTKPAPNTEPFAGDNPIDLLVQASLAERGLRLSPEADRATLIRRLTLDLTGLPPTREEVDRFLSDTDPQAWQRLVDRLLKSPHFGERMAWDWLDAARYADSNGYQGDRERTMWPWRDWVVRAFNQNLPFDQFSVWQLAGDLLPDATFEQKLATGFCRNHMINGEGGRIAEENRVDYIMDMAETTGTVWLGLTFNCCRCHDHKFDPLTRRDYYQLFAFFNQTPVTGGGGDPQTAPVLSAPDETQRLQIDALQRESAEIEKQLGERRRQLAVEQSEWERRQRGEPSSTSWRTLVPQSVTAEHQELRVLEDHSVLAGGDPNPANDTYTVTATTDLSGITGIRLEALRHESLTQNSLSRAASGNFVLTEFEVFVSSGEPAERRAVKIGSAQATFEQGALTIKSAFDGDRATGWAVYEGRVVDRAHEAVFRFAEPIAGGPGTQLSIVLRHDSPHENHNLGRFRISLTTAAEPALDPQQTARAEALAAAEDRRDKSQRDLLAKWHQESDEAYKQLAARLEQIGGQLKKVRDAVPRVMVMEELAAPRKTFMLERGLYNKPGEEVTAATPAHLPPMLPSPQRAGLSSGTETTGGTETAGGTSAVDIAVTSSRLDLAEWLVDPRNPLTARVTVNRFWQQLFGIGLVKTTEDFGSQGELPVHGELLDWLACEFRDSGWDVKALLRLIVTSKTYRQSSHVTPQLWELDPENRLLARGPRFRMPSWMLRDQALAASGLLAGRLGGPPVKGYQPAGVWEEATFGNKRYAQDHGESLYRRSLYTFWRRIVAPTMFFDNASRQTCTVKPLRTNTPLHALVTLNDVTFVEAARTLAQRVLLASEGDEDSRRFDEAYRRVLVRSPDERERNILLAGLRRTREQFTRQPDSARQLLAMGESPRDERLDAVEHASWTALCLAILNLDAAVTKE